MTFASHQIHLTKTEPVTKTIQFTPPLAQLIATVIDHALLTEVCIDGNPLTKEQSDVLTRLSQVLMDDGRGPGSSDPYTQEQDDHITSGEVEIINDNLRNG